MSRPTVKRISGSAALIAAFLAAPAAQAQLLLAEPVLGYAPEESPMPADVAQVSVSRDIFRSDARIKVSARTLREEDGSVIVRRGLIGSWTISSGLEAGVGLFAVNGDGRKHNEFKRSWTVKDLTPKNGNIAAVGMKLRF
ncbi:MAG: hypothetical protein M3N39_02620 [Pseudomonadota bacterium]|nr:hypothetical protein [Pseudomonadota bacterium]